ncbi:MAG: hypothetical protein H0U26_09100 [Acidimicrobiia bacterium]|nr:hypothetical protein [Acidimicrobiia bacterium]
MHHFRGKLLDGGRVRLDPANVYVLFHATAGGPDQGWYGYLLISSGGDVDPGGVYTLTLTDGRSGSLRVDQVTPEDSVGFRATFVGEGPLR